MFLNTIPFLTDHHQWPLAHLLAYASAALPTNPILPFHFMKLEKTRDRKEKDEWEDFRTREDHHKKKCAVAYLLAYAHWPYLSVSNESYLFHEQARNQSTISFLANHQQWPVAYHLAYAHRPHQLIQYILLIFTSSQEPNQQFLIIQKGFF